MDKSFFLFLDNCPLNSKNLLTGFLNSFFLVLPFSVSQFLSIRAFLINGLWAGISAASGTILGQLTFFCCILFGIEFFIVPFLNFEGIMVSLGLLFLINIIYKLIHTPNMAILNFSQKKQLLEFFKLNFILAWLEQGCICSYFGNLTFNASPNLIQSNDSNEYFFLTNFIYLTGILLGSIAWTALFGFLILKIRNFIANTIITKISFITLNQRLHSISLILITILGFSSIPYYGFDYLLYGPLGFIYEDKALETIQPKTGYAISSGSSDQPLLSIALDPLPFDKIPPLNVFPPEMGTLKYEQYRLESELFWKNRSFFRRTDPLANTHRPLTNYKVNEMEELPFEIPNYESENLDFYDLPIKFFQKNEQNIEMLLDSLFRDDVYLSSRDKNSDQSKSSKITQVHHLFREKYYRNPFYRALINFDMHGFLDGQPKSTKLTASDEMDLFQRRIILQNYLTSMQEYKLSILNTKQSYAEKVYNQQFKGSLSHIRHFNAINLNYNFKQTDNTTELARKVLKFDLPRYNEFSNETKLFLHEELEPIVGEEPSKYLLLNNTAPLYVGWDGELRKFLVKVPGIPEKLELGDQSEEKLESTLLKFKNEENIIKNYQTKPPIYFSFQSWSPAVENIKTYLSSQNTLQLPSVSLSSNELENLKEALNFEMSLRTNSNLGKNVTEALTDKTTDSLLSRLPTYDWHWTKSLLDLKLRKYLDLGDALPAKLDGIAWPGVSNKSLIPKLNS